MTIKNLCNVLITDYWTSVQPPEFRSFGSLTGRRNWFRALRHFKNYAYERNVSGAANRYRQIAEEAMSCLQTAPRNCDAHTEAEIWNAFRTNCLKGNIKYNPTVDPLKPSSGRKKNLVRFVSDVTKDKDTTVAAWAFRMITENKVEEAHGALKSVWGIGNKIASFYLRDIFWLGNNLHPQLTVKNDHLLQPVDIWIKRASREPGNADGSVQSVAKCISDFERRNDLAHGGGNIALWMLGGRYLTGEEFRLVVQAIGQRETALTPQTLAIADRFEKFGASLRRVLTAS